MLEKENTREKIMYCMKANDLAQFHRKNLNN